MTTAAMTKAAEPAGIPDMKVSVRQVFGIDSDLEVRPIPKSTRTCRTSIRITGSIAPPRSPSSRVSRTTAVSWSPAITHRQVDHIEQVAARLNWPCVRVNLDSHISRIDLVGKDSIVIKDGKQVTEFRDGILPWALQHNIRAGV